MEEVFKICTHLVHKSDSTPVTMDSCAIIEQTSNMLQRVPLPSVVTVTCSCSVIISFKKHSLKQHEG